MTNFTKIGRIDVPKSSGILANRFRELILCGEFPDGSHMPSEREMMNTTGLSRGSVREALRILETEGLVQTRPGRYGGTVVALPTDKQLARQVSIFAKGRGIPIEALLEAREGFEPLLAELAAKNRTEADIETLRAISTRLEVAVKTNAEEFLRINVEWHLALATASHNPLLIAFLRSISDLILDATQHDKFTSEAVREIVVLAHARILEAVANRVPAAARRRMQRHVCSYSQEMNVLLTENARQHYS